MASTQIGAALRHIHQLFAEGGAGPRSDGQLLERFLARRDEAAFALLVERHGPMVLGTCRAVLRDPADAEDAVQATFLLLVRKARALRDPDALGGWLHRVARRVAVRANQDAARRRDEERHAGTLKAAEGGPPAELLALLHEEIDRLPARHRLPVVLHHLEDRTHAQVAHQLRWSERTVRRRLAEARERLRDRLARRGVRPAGPALAVALGRGAPAVPLPPSWAGRTVRAALSGATGGAASTIAVAWMEALARPMGLVRLTMAAAVGLTALGLAWAAAGPVPDPGAREAAPMTPPDASAPAPPAAPAGDDEADVSTYAGRVVDPQGRPVAGARLFLVPAFVENATSPVRATTGRDGRFRFAVPGSEFRDPAYRPHARVAARAEGFGLGQADSEPPDAGHDLTIRLAEELPIEGRVVDLEGRPIAGATVRVQAIWAPPDGSLDRWVAAVKARESDMYSMLYKYLGERQPAIAMAPDLVPPVTTDAAGRFRIVGIGREVLAELKVEGPGVRLTDNLYVMTRLGGTVSGVWDPRFGASKPVTYHDARPALAVLPSRPIEGVVRDADTGKPLPKIEIRSYEFADDKIGNNTLLGTTTDADGRFRLDGMPPGRGNRLMARQESGPYLPRIVDVDGPPGLGPQRCEVRLKRGIVVEGRIADAGTDAPVAAWIGYLAAADNPHLDESPGFKDLPDVYSFKAEADKDGRFRVAVLPGRGLLAVETRDRRHPALNGGKPRPLGDYVPRFMHFTNGTAPIDVPEGVETFRFDITLDPGRTVAGTVLDPDGEPLAGSVIYGLGNLGFWPVPPAEGAGFTVEALQRPRVPRLADLLRSRGLSEAVETLKPEPPRTLVFQHEGRKLAGWRDVRWDEPGPLRVTLEPWAAVSGRLLDEEGRPRAEATLVIHAEKPRLGGGRIEHRPERVRTDADGRFRVEGLAPGLAYRVAVQAPPGQQAERRIDVPPARPGEERDLGDLTVTFRNQGD